ncbi:NUDIX hydrolase [Clostridium akagii]|uniref:NUDIX hydrolase n=1 Tax=Clostridium akagii TaxID=91623 RepID=UPI00047BB93F|nr:NUDIX hydrolase [Clostridium akagii]
MNFGEETVSKKKIYEGKVINLYLHKVRLQDGNLADREVINHPGGVAILAYKDSETILMVEQYRKPIEKVLLELPAGKLEKNEDTKECGLRELEEETGYKAKSFEYLGKIVSSPGFCNEYIYLYKAENLYDGIIGGDEDEFLNVREIKINHVKEMIKTGQIIDAKTISCFMYL